MRGNSHSPARRALATLSVSALIVVSASLLAAAPAKAATVLRCAGEATIAPVGSSLEVRHMGPLTVSSFDFTGTHPLCDRSGTHVDGTWSGHIVQTLLPDGTTLMAFAAHEQFPGASWDAAGLVAISPGNEWTLVWGRAGNGEGWLDGATSVIQTVSPTPTGAVGFETVITWR
jgi:hypothetical protein